jgi:hypothetical protein
MRIARPRRIEVPSAPLGISESLGTRYPAGDATESGKPTEAAGTRGAPEPQPAATSRAERLERLERRPIDMERGMALG